MRSPKQSLASSLDLVLEDWVQWAHENGASLEFVQFLRCKPNLLCAFDAHQDVNPAPHAWAEGVVPPKAEFD